MFMCNKVIFDNEKYLSFQSENIKKRIDYFGGKLYLEFGGKLFDDYHASRVLPGFEPDSKIRMLQTLKDEVEIVIVINANDIEKKKRRGDLGITYDDDTLRLIDIFHELELFVGSVVVTCYTGQPSADAFLNRLTSLGIKNYKHYPIDGYPSDINKIVSDEGYGKNEYIETERSLVVITAPGPGSGKMATCLSQIYHDNKLGIKSGYAKYETFPIWNLPLNHPVNLAYEAATADLNDVNMIDPFHLEAYGKTSVNYNRDVEIFPVLSEMFTRIQGFSPYKSPTDMGVNMAGFCIVDDKAVCDACKMEILRRYYTAQAEFAKGKGSAETVRKIELVMNREGIKPEMCPAIGASLEKAESTGAPAGAMSISADKIITGKTSDLLGASSALLLNTLKALAGIDENINIISPEVIEPICKLKTTNLHHRNPRLHSDEVLLALCVSAVTNPDAQAALNQLDKLRGCDAHFSVIISEVDERTYKRLGINVTCEPRYEKRK